MEITVRQESLASLANYGDISIAFEVHKFFEVTTDPVGQFHLELQSLSSPYLKDYDAVSDRPAEWRHHFDVSNWVVFSASAEGQRIGGMVIAWARSRRRHAGRSGRPRCALGH